jgi:hypothetical protein
MTATTRLLVACLSCKTKCVINGRTSVGTRCSSCGAPLPHAFVEVVTGYVYVLSNPGMPGLLKIGYTTNPVQERVQQLNTTGVPHPFAIDAIYESEDARRDEQRVHTLMGPRRVNDRREFFRADTLLALAAISDVMGRGPSFLRPEVHTRYAAFKTGTASPPPPRAAPVARSKLVPRLSAALQTLATSQSTKARQQATDELQTLIPEARSLEEAIAQARWLVEESPPQV